MNIQMMKNVNNRYRTALMLFLVLAACKKNTDQPGTDLATGLHIADGKYLADKCGNKVVLRGVNMGSVYAVNFGTRELEEIEKTGANSVRIVLTRQFQDWSNGGAVTAVTGARIEPLITSCLAKGMIPILELHDFTGTANVGADLPKATQWWTNADVKSVLLNYQKSIVVNIANEPDNGSANNVSYSNANSTAIKALRDAGYTCPIMVDAPDWGKNYKYFVTDGKALLDADPLHNTLFSVHAYWPVNGAFGSFSDAKITGYMNELKQTGLPIVIGELAKADVQNGIAYPINYSLMMKLSQENEFGYLVWWWGFYNNPGANNQLSMTSNGLFTGLQGADKAMAVDDANSIKKTSKRICP